MIVHILLLAVDNIKRVLIALLLVTVLAGCGAGGGSSNEDVQYKGLVVPDFVIEANYSGLLYPIKVYLPEGYDESASTLYPTLYMLDAEFRFDTVIDLVERKNKSIIVVGISNALGVPQRRRVDYRLPGATDHYNFLITQIIPYIDANYASDTNQRAMSGHSLGGLFTGLTMLIEDPTNRYFNKYLSQDGSYWDQPILTRSLEEQLAAVDSVLPVQLVISGASESAGNGTEVLWFNNLLASRNYSQLDLIYITSSLSHDADFPFSMDKALDIFYPDTGNAGP